MVILIFWLSIICTIVTAYLGAKMNTKWFWVAGIFAYIFSFLGSMSIGLFTLSLAIIFWCLALGYSMDWIKRSSHLLISIIIGLALWLILVYFVDDYWLFLPFKFIGF